MFSTHELPETWFDPIHNLSVIDARGSLFNTRTGMTIVSPDVPKSRINGITGYHDDNFVGRHRLYEDFHNDDDVRFISDNGNLWRMSEVYSHIGQPSVSIPFTRNVEIGPRWERV